MTELQITYRPVDDLVPYARNARTHSPEQIDRIAASIREYGWTNPILTDGEAGIIAGHGRLAAARKLGLQTVPTIELSGLSEAQKRAYILADNRLALDAGWDEELLKIELQDLQSEGVNLEGIGFSANELGELLEPSGSEEQDREENPYTAITDTVQYDPTGRTCELSECMDDGKANELMQEIEASSLTEPEKLFLRKAAARHFAFNYGKIADYYANSASPEMQRLMEKSALVIVDYENAVANGFVKLSKKLEELVGGEGDEA